VPPRLAGPSAAGCMSGNQAHGSSRASKWLSKRFGQQFIIENPPGANLRAPEVGLPLLGGPRRPQRKPRASFHGSETK
jgi:hypothetical protein